MCHIIVENDSLTATGRYVKPDCDLSRSKLLCGL